MSDLISRQAAIDAVNEWLKLYVINRTMSNVTSIQDILRQLPSAQPQRKSARWEILYPNHTYKYHCSECGANYKYMFDFCPSCGARMEGDEE